MVRRRAPGGRAVGHERGLAAIELTAPLGRSGLHFTRVGFGASAVGGERLVVRLGGAQDDVDSLAAMRRALEHGVMLLRHGLVLPLAVSGLCAFGATAYAAMRA